MSNEAGKMNDAQRAARRFLQGKMKAEKQKLVAEKEVERLKELRQKKFNELKKMEKNLSSFDDNTEILIAMAGMNVKEDEAKNRSNAGDCLYKLLGMFHRANENKSNLLESCKELNPQEVLFEYIVKSASYNEQDRILSIDGKILFKLIRARVAEQKAMLDKAKADFVAMEEDFKKEKEKAD